MAKNTTHTPDSGSRQKIEEFKSVVKKKVDSGYTCLGLSLPQVSDIPVASQEDKRSALAEAGSKFPGGKSAHCSFGMFDSKQSNPSPVEGAGTPGFGYIPWGPNNDLPNQIYSLASNLPYTDAAINFLTNLATGRGPKLMYKWARYAGGTVTEEFIPYEHAGVLLRNRLRELKSQLAAQKEDRQESEQSGGEGSGQNHSTIEWEDAVLFANGKNTCPVEEEHPENEPGTLEYEIRQLENDYKEWERVLPEHKRFTSENNLTLHFLECMTDYMHMDIYFPLVGFEIGTSGAWNPKIRAVDRIPDVCARQEQMDDRLRVNHVYYSEKWRQDATAELSTRDIVAYPAVQNKTMLNGWKNIVKRNQRTRLKERPIWVACPIKYPSMQNPYYPRPAWWSIFPSMVYEYASTLVVDKAIARNNATMWSKIIFIDQEYLSRIFDMQGAETPEEQEKIRNDIYNRVNRLLQRKENNGKTLLMDKYLGPDGKTVQYSIDIVDVPQPASGADTKDELEEISSIIFFAFGVHPALIGATPGKSGSTGGTFQRELLLIKQNLLDPARSLYLKFLQNIYMFNEWDTDHAVWKVSDLVLTTLDRSKTGTEEVVN